MSQAGSFNNGNGPGSGNVRTLTGNTGGPVPPDFVGNIDILGDGGITVTGNPGTNTLTINDGGSASNFIEDVGFAAPIAGSINVLGTNVVITAGNTLNTITIGLTEGGDGQIPIGATSADPIWANITSTDMSITISNGPNSIDLSASGGGGATEFDADTGTATPMSGVINIFGGPNINTDASGNTVNVNLDTSIDLPDTNVGFTTGTLLLNSVPFLHNFGGTGGGGGSSANIFLGGAGNDTLSTGNILIGIGTSSLGSIDTGSSCIAIGGAALFNASSATGNIAIGVQAGLGVLTGTDNIYIGGGLVGGADGIQNVAIGSGGALGGGTNTNGNVVIGYASGNNLSDGNNIAIGYEALNGVGDCDTTIAIGMNTGNGLAGATTTSNILIGNAGVNTDNNTIRIGTQGTSTGQQDTAYMAGIYQSTVGGTNEFVIVDNTGKLGSTSSAPTGGVKTTTFTMSGTFTKDTNSKYIEVYAWGGGAGGGSGRQGVTTSSGGGAGGGSGMAFFYSIPSSFWDTNTTITVGAGATGGAAQTSATTDGNPGGGGGVTIVGSIDSTGAAIGGAGAGGTATTTATSTGGICFGNFLSNTGTNGAGGSNISPSNAQASPLDSRYQTGTGGGGGSGADAIVPRQASNGGDSVAPNGSTVILAGGLGGIETGTIDGTSGNNQPTTGAIIIGGTGGGGGGGQSSGIVAGNGGIGGFPGGGGGGGGGSLNGTDSGTGGDGADGYVLIIEILG